MTNVREHIEMENLDGRCIRFANFRGIEKNFNPKGKRNFNIDILDEEFAKKLKDEGWAVKFPEPREDGTTYPPRLKVNVAYNAEKNLGPRVMMEQGGNKVFLTEDTIGDLDDMEIICVKAIDIRPYNWESPTGYGVSAYLDRMRVEVAKDIFCD